MNAKYLMLFLVIMSVFFAGCAENEQGPSEEDVNTSGQIPDSVGADGQAEVQPDGAEEHIVRLEHYEKMTPPSLDIKKGDTVSWWSQKRQGIFTLVSEEELFPDQELKYKVPFTYTFNETGTYRFTVAEVPAMNLTVSVS